MLEPTSDTIVEGLKGVLKSKLRTTPHASDPILRITKIKEGGGGGHGMALCLCTGSQPCGLWARGLAGANRCVRLACQPTNQ